MSKIEDVTLSDNIGNEYTFEVYPKESRFDDVAGVYAFTRRSANQYGVWHKILYMGETGSLKRRQLHSYHHKLGLAQRRRMTHICVLQTRGLGKSERQKLQENLIAEYDPCLNEHKK